MKKNRHMKIVVILLLTIFTNSVAFANYQDRVKNSDVTINIKNKPIKRFLEEIQKQTDLDFVYNDTAISEKINKSLNVKNIKVDKVLDELFSGTELTYRVEENIITIRKRQEVQPLLTNQKSDKIKVIGRVLDKDDKPIAGASVIIAGTSQGAITDSNGSFIVNITVGGKLDISFLGYVNQNITISKSNEKNILKVVLVRDNIEVDDVVVVAYGSTTKRSTTGSISTIDAKDLEGIVSSNIGSMLQGKVAGLDVTNISGAPGGSGAALTIRGYNSLDTEASRRFSNPLWVVDGVPMNTFTSPVTGTNMLSDLNPDMIESISVLKDASAAAIYGSRAANGVIIVTTKQGKANQKTNIEVNLSQSISYVPTLPTLTVGKGEGQFRMNTLKNKNMGFYDKTINEWRYFNGYEDYVENYVGKPGSIDHFFNAQEIGNTGVAELQDSLNSFYNNATNFFPLYYEVANITNANISVTGGSDISSYGIGVGYYDEGGIVRGTGYNRISINTNLIVKPIKKLTADIRVYASYSDRSKGGSARNAVETVPGDPFELSTMLPGEGSSVWNNIVNDLNTVKERSKDFRFRGSFKLGYDITKDLNISSIVSTDLALSRNNRFEPSSVDPEYGFSKSEGSTALNTMLLNENFISYKKKFLRHHGINILGGFSVQNDISEMNIGHARNMPSDLIEYVPDGMPDYIVIDGTVVPLKDYMSNFEEKSLVSWFGRVEYDYKDRYFLSASFRRDGSSVFGKNNKWGNFPSVAGSWIFSDESGLKNVNWLNFGKLRASWGTSGMIFSQTYLALGTLEVGEKPNLGNPTYGPNWQDGLHNDDLSWEMTQQTDIGVDLRMFDNRFTITADWYYRHTVNLLGKVFLPGAGTYAGYVQQWANVASIANTGFELAIGYDVIRESNTSLRLSLTFASNNNRLLDTYNAEDYSEIGGVIGKPLNGIYAMQTNGIIQSLEQLEKYYSITGNRYLSPKNTPEAQFRPGDYNIIDANGDGWINADDDNVYIGSALPKMTGGFLIDFRWRNFDLNASFSYQLGRHIYNSASMTSLKTDDASYMHPLTLDLKDYSFWEKPGDNAQYAQMKYAEHGRWSDMIDRDVEKVNTLKLNTIIVGYNLQGSLLDKLNLSRLRIFISGENLFTLSNYSGFSPETVDIRHGIDYGTNYPLSRKFTLGLSVKF